MATKTVRLQKAWHMHIKGAVLTVGAPVADLLIQSGRAIEEKPQPPAKAGYKVEQKRRK